MILRSRSSCASLGEPCSREARPSPASSRDAVSLPGASSLLCLRRDHYQREQLVRLWLCVARGRAAGHVRRPRQLGPVWEPDGGPLSNSSPTDSLLPRCTDTRSTSLLPDAVLTLDGASAASQACTAAAVSKLPTRVRRSESLADLHASLARTCTRRSGLAASFKVAQLPLPSTSSFLRGWKLCSQPLLRLLARSLIFAHDGGPPVGRAVAPWRSL